MCQKWQGLCSILSNPNTHSWLTIGFVTWVTRHRWVPLLDHGLRSPQVFSDIRVAQAIVVCVVFCRSLFVLLSLVSFGHCIVCHVSIYGSSQCNSSLWAICSWWVVHKRPVALAKLSVPTHHLSLFRVPWRLNL